MRLDAVLLTACLCGCVATRIQPPAQSAARQLDSDTDRYILAGVENEEQVPVGRAASSPKGYDGLTVYGPSPRAIQRLHGIEREYGLREIQAWPIMPLHMHCAVLELPENADRATVLAALVQDRRVVIAQPLQTFATQSASYNDPYVGLQQGFQQLDVVDAHALSRGEGVRIAIIDTGVDTRHPDLEGVIVESRNFVDSDAEQFRRDRHGTEVAGIIAAVPNNRQGIVGVAPGARLYVYKACWQLRAEADAASCNSFTLARALTAAIDAGVQLVNLSLAGPADPLLHALLEAGKRRGILFVAAAPGNGAEAGLLGHGGVIAVANGGAQEQPGTPLRAPGREILTLLPGGHYDFASGVSMATAHVTGTAALLLARNPRLSGAAVYQLLRDTTTAVAAADGGDSGDDSINACSAVTALEGHGSCRGGAPEAHRVAMH